MQAFFVALVPPSLQYTSPEPKEATYTTKNIIKMRPVVAIKRWEGEKRDAEWHEMVDLYTVRRSHL